MIKAFLDWMQDRTGYRDLIHEALEEPIPGGAKWRYIFGSALTGAFAIQVFTGLLLMLSYSPSSTTAWGSVFYINNQMTMGWIIRGVHHFGSQAMVVLLALHLIQVLIAGAYRAPREFNWWFGLILMFLTLGLSLTGYLLPWDQKGYWATKVATNIAASTPVIGPYVQEALVGGREYGNQTLTRFYGLHVGVLPALLVLMLVIHVALFRRHGVAAPVPKDHPHRDSFWPKQVFLDTVGIFVLLGILLFLTFREHGANLDAPADAAASDYPARPEWYFLSLFQMLKYPAFAGEKEVIGAIIIPGAVVAVMFLLPFLNKIMPNKLAHFLACSFVFSLVGAAGYLTYDAVREDNANAKYQEVRHKADAQRLRALALAQSPEHGVPPDGANYLLQRDPFTQGRAVLEKKCLGCHAYDGFTTDKRTASDLKGFGTKAWLDGLLDKPTDPKYFGAVPQAGGMSVWKSSTKLKPDELKQVAEFVAAQAKMSPEMTPDEWDQSFETEPPALPLFVKDCARCHSMGNVKSEDHEQDAPDLFGWGSPQWIARMIRKPHAADKYAFLYEAGDAADGGGKKAAANMPAFPTDQLSENDLQMILKYLQGQYLAPSAAKGE